MLLKTMFFYDFRLVKPRIGEKLVKLLISLDLDAPARVTGLATAPGAEVAGTSPGVPQG